MPNTPDTSAFEWIDRSDLAHVAVLRSVADLDQVTASATEFRLAPPMINAILWNCAPAHP